MDCQFRMRLDAVPGLYGVARLLEVAGVISWEQLGELDEARWQGVLDVLPQKRLDLPYPGDLLDDRRLAPGHLSSLDELRKAAVKTHRAAAAARGQALPATATAATAGSSTVGSQASPTTGVDIFGIACLQSLAWHRETRMLSPAGPFPARRSRPDSAWPAASEAAWPQAQGAGPCRNTLDPSAADVKALLEQALSSQQRGSHDL